MYYKMLFGHFFAENTAVHTLMSLISGSALLSAFLLCILEFIREEVIAILGIVFTAFFNQVSMEVHHLLQSFVAV